VDRVVFKPTGLFREGDALNVPPESVTLNVMLCGGGFGRKSKPDYVAEAALISKAIGGAAVKVVWTREDDIHNDFYHTVSVERLEGARQHRQGCRLAPQQRGTHDLVALQVGSQT